MNELELFLMCFPVKFIKSIILLETNTMQEFFVFLVSFSCHVIRVLRIVILT